MKRFRSAAAEKSIPRRDNINARITEIEILANDNDVAFSPPIATHKQHIPHIGLISSIVRVLISYKSHCADARQRERSAQSIVGFQLGDSTAPNGAFHGYKTE